MKRKIEYVWLDGYGPEPNLRSKVKVIDTSAKVFNLKEIPECIADLPNLYFLNLKGSPNVHVPEKIQQKGTDMGGGMWDLQD